MRAFIVCVLLISGCAHSIPPSSVPGIGVPQFDAWCRGALAHPDKSAKTRLFHDAWLGSSSALQSYFLDAYRSEISSSINPADEEMLGWTLEALLYRLGDPVFAKTLQGERPEVRSAVRHFLVPTHIKSGYAETRALLESAPHVDFLLERTYRILNAPE